MHTESKITSCQITHIRKYIFVTVYAVIFCHPNYLSLATKGCDSVLAFLCDTILMEEELLHLPRLPHLDRSRYFSVRSVFQWRGMRLV